jgi:hypothetical protein
MFFISLSPSTQLPHNPINLRVLSQTTEPTLHRIHTPRAGFALDSSPFPVFSSLSSNQQFVLGISPFIHRAFVIFRIGVLIWFFGFRSTHLHHLLQDMLLNNGFFSVFGVRRWSSPPPPPPKCWLVFPTR